MANIISKFDPGKLLGGTISGNVSRFRGNIGSGDRGYRVLTRSYSTIRSMEKRFESRGAGKARPIESGSPQRATPSTTAPAPSSPIRGDYIQAGDEFIHKGNTYIVPEGHVFDTRSGRLILDPATSKSRSFISFAKAGVIMQSSFDNFKTVTFRKLDKIIDLVSRLQASSVTTPDIAPAPIAPAPAEVAGEPQRDKPNSWLPFLAGMISGIGMKYFVRPLVELFKRIVSWIKGLWNAVRSAFARIASLIVNAFKRFWQFMTKIKNAFLNVVTFIKNLIPKTWQALKNIGSRIGKFFTDKFTAAKDFIVKRLASVKNYLIELGKRALLWLGKTLVRLLPASVRKLIPATSRAGKAIAAAIPPISEAGAKELLAKSSGPGMKLLKALSRIPGVNLAATGAFAVYEIRDADEELAAGKIDEKQHNTKVGKIVAGAFGSYLGGAAGFALGMMVLKATTATGAGIGAVAGLGIGAIPGAIVGALTGTAALLALTVGGAVAGDWAFKELLTHYGSPEKLGEAINDFLNTSPPINDEAQKLTNKFTELLKQREDEARAGDTGPFGSSSARDLYRHLALMSSLGIIDEKQHEELRNQINDAKERGLRYRENQLARARAGRSSNQKAVEQEYSQAGVQAEALAAAPTNEPPPVQSPPPSPPSPSGDVTEDTHTVQPVPSVSIPPSPTYSPYTDEHGNVIVINHQTNTNHQTTVNIPNHHNLDSVRSPDPWQN